MDGFSRLDSLNKENKSILPEFWERERVQSSIQLKKQKHVELKKSGGKTRKRESHVYFSTNKMQSLSNRGDFFTDFYTAIVAHASHFELCTENSYREERKSVAHRLPRSRSGSRNPTAVSPSVRPSALHYLSLTGPDRTGPGRSTRVKSC